MSAPAGGPSRRVQPKLRLSWATSGPRFDRGSEITWNGGAASAPRTPAQAVALPCGSASTSNTACPCRARQAAMFTANVVLPTPPLAIYEGQYHVTLLPRMLYVYTSICIYV